MGGSSSITDHRWLWFCFLCPHLGSVLWGLVHGIAKYTHSLPFPGLGLYSDLVWTAMWTLLGTSTQQLIEVVCLLSKKNAAKACYKMPRHPKFKSRVFLHFQISLTLQQLCVCSCLCVRAVLSVTYPFLPILFRSYLCWWVPSDMEALQLASENQCGWWIHWQLSPKHWFQQRW